MEIYKAKKSDIFKYAFGGFGSNVPFLLAMGYLTFFYTDVLGISAMAVGGLMLVARVIDAVTDPLMGIIGDRTRSKLGRFRPWIIAGSPFLGLSIFALFSAPSLSPFGKVLYAYVIYIFFSLASTVVNIPYHSLTPVMSTDSNQRTIVAVAKQMMAIPAQLLVLVMGLPLVNAFGGGTKGWAMFGFLCALLTTVSFWICAWGAKPYDKMELVDGLEPIKLKNQLKLVYKNRPLLMLLIAFGTDLIAFAASQGVNLFYFIYYLNRPDLVPLISLLNLGVNLVVMALIPALAKKFGKKPLYLAATFICMVPLAVLFFLPSSQVNLIVILIVISSMVATIPGNLGWAMLPDCVEYGEWKHGIRGEGTITSSLTFINKLGMAIGGALVGIILAKSGYVPNAAQSESALTAIRFMRFIFPLLGYLCSFISMQFYTITNSFYAKMVKEIQERN